MKKLTPEEVTDYRNRLTALLDAARLLNTHYSGGAAAAGLSFWENAHQAPADAQPDAVELTRFSALLWRKCRFSEICSAMVEEFQDLLEEVNRQGKEAGK